MYCTKCTVCAVEMEEVHRVVEDLIVNWQIQFLSSQRRKLWNEHYMALNYSPLFTDYNCI
jgi:hypothetical protein